MNLKTTVLLLVLTIGISQFNHAQTNSNFIKESIASKTLNENRSFWVSLPENYDAASNRTYPVIYLVDGHYQMETLKMVYDNYWGHYLPKMILVGISNRDNRTRDLTPTKLESRNGGPVTVDSGKSDQFALFIKQELIPHIDANYNTMNYRTLIGHSYGGLFTIYTMLNHPDLFKNYVAIDPSLDWGDQAILKALKTKNDVSFLNGKSLFISLAAEQLNMMDESVTIDNLMDDTSEFSLFARSIVSFTDYLKDADTGDFNLRYKVYPEDLHGTITLPTIRDGLVDQFSWFQFKSPQKYNNPETSLSEIKQLLQKQSEVYSAHIGYKVPPLIEELFVGYGFMYLQTGQPEKAEYFFHMAVKHYPKSIEGYEALIDFYESKEDFANAFKYAEMAFESTKLEDFKAKMIELKGME